MIKNILLNIALIVFLTSCSTTSEEKTNNENIEDNNNKEKPISISEVTDDVFYLKSIDLSKPAVKNNNVTIIFSENDHFGDVLKGNAGCNNYYTPYSTTRSSLLTGKIATTNNKCKYDQRKLESFIFKVFSENPIISLKGNKLYLKGISNNLIFEKKEKILTKEDIKLLKDKEKDRLEFDKMKHQN